MASLHLLLRNEIIAQHKFQQNKYAELQTKKLCIDLTRGKPSPKQLDLSNILLKLPNSCFLDQNKFDTRNYGGLSGLLELRKIFAKLLNIPAQNLIAGNNASLELMHDIVSFSMLYGNIDSFRPWVKENIIKFLCPTPGYDRHFSMLESFGIEMISIPNDENGPHINLIEKLIKTDRNIKGMWCVPQYSNPSGITYSWNTIKRLIQMDAAAEDFRLIWDNAYVIHTLTNNFIKPTNILNLAKAANNPNRPLIFTSTSKVTFPGSGISFFGSSLDNIRWYIRHASKKSIGPDKINQLRHSLFLNSTANVKLQMERHLKIITPKFASIVKILRNRLDSYDIVSWNTPKGGYFISFDVWPGTAKRIVKYAKKAGIILNESGSAFPYHNDPDDKNIRIAPTFSELLDINEAIDGLVTCTLLATIEFLLQ